MIIKDHTYLSAKHSGLSFALIKWEGILDDLCADMWPIRGKFYLIQHIKEMCLWHRFFFINDFYFFHYSWFAVFCQFSTVQQSDLVTHTHTHTRTHTHFTYIHSFSHITLHHAPSQVTRHSSQFHTAGSHCVSFPNAIVCIY